MKIVTDSVDKFIRAILRETDEFKPNSIRYGEIDFQNGIFVAIGILNTSESNDTAIAQILFRKNKNDFDGVKKWIKEHKGIVWDSQEVEFSAVSDSMTLTYTPKEEVVYQMAKTISAVPIFKVGTHNNKKFTLKDLNEMVTNYLRLKEENKDFQIPIKIGHDGPMEQEKIAVGWMENLRVQGEFLLADFVDLADETFNLIKEKRLKNRSIEVFFNFVNSVGEKLGTVIKGIALLGGSLPAVNLPNVAFIAIPDAVSHFGEDQSFDVFTEAVIGDEEEEIQGAAKDEASFNQTEIKKEKHIKEGAMETPTVESEIVKEEFEIKKEVENVVEKEVVVEEKGVSVDEATFAKLDLLKNFSSQEDILNKLTEYDALKKKTEEQEIKFQAQQEEKRRDEVSEFVESLQKEDKIEPSKTKIVTELLYHLNDDSSLELEFEHGVKKEKTYFELFKSFLKSLPEQGLLKEFAKVSGMDLLNDKDPFKNFIAKRGLSEAEYDALSVSETKLLVTEYTNELKEEL